MTIDAKLGRQAVTVLLVVAALQSGCGGGGITELEPQKTTDTTPPQITAITGISDGDTVAGSAVITATATDDTGIASFKLSIDGKTVVEAALATYAL